MNDTGLGTSTTLAVERTRLAYERTMMAWVRTGTSLIAFGFTVYKFFQFDSKLKADPGMLIGPREFAIALIVIGLLALLLGSAEHRRDLRSLRKINPDMPASLSQWVALVMSLLGLVSLVVVLMHA